MNVCTPEQRRGKIMGLWGSAASAGNVFGILLYTSLTGAINSSWELILATCALVIIIIACLFKVVLKSSIESEHNCVLLL
jgi:MFS family permease